MVGPRPRAISASRTVRVLPLDPAVLRALLEDDRQEAQQLLGVSLFDDYPDEAERRYLAVRLRQMWDDPRFEAWGEHAFALGARMVGHGGYNGPPGRNAAQAPNAVELGYAIFAPFRGRGYATEAALALMDAAEEREDVRHFVLAVSPDNVPSLAVARKLGFTRTGERVDAVRGLEHVLELHRDLSRPPRRRSAHAPR